MARKPGTKAKEPIKSDSFIDALKFVDAVLETKGDKPCETNSILNDGWVLAFNGIVAAGHPIKEDLLACPHNTTMISALSKCGENLSITQLANDRLSIKSDKFKAIVPCLPFEEMMYPVPDPPCAIIDDRFKAALQAVAVLASANADNVIEASILMNGMSLVATNRKVIFEYWHGIDLPPNISLPKSFVAPLLKNQKTLAKFGFSNSSATFYFSDDSWIRTQFFAEQWPDTSRILDVPCHALPVPTDLFAGLAAVAPFSESGNVYFDAGILRSHQEGAAGASYEVAGLPKGPIFPADQLALLKPYAQQIDFMAPGVHDSQTALKFFGENIRGAISGMRK